MLYKTSSHDLFADAFFIHHDRLMFASLHGRDAGVLSFLAALNTSPAQGGLDRVGFRKPDDAIRFPFRTTASLFHNLSKRISKYMTHNFGMLSHVFVYTDELATPNLDNRTAWIVRPASDTGLDQAIWHSICHLSDIPLLDKWQDCLLADLTAQGSVSYFHPDSDNNNVAIYGVQAVRISIPDDFDRQITGALRQGALLP